MSKFNKSHLVFVVVLFLTILIYPGTVLAEIATVRDWIGLFKSGNGGNAKTDTVNGTSWVYTSNTPCSKASPGPSAVPKLADNSCSFAISSPFPGNANYEYRMYANDQETADALMATSPTFRIGQAAQDVQCPVQNLNPRAQGLISAPTISTNFGNPSGNCVIGNPATFAPFKIPSYDDLKSIYFTQSKSTSKFTTTTLPVTFSADGIYNITGDLTISAALSGTGTEVVFIDNGANPANLTINKDIIYPTSGNGGFVFIVKGDVRIDKTVNRIDAVIIAGGVIYTATDYQATPATTTCDFTTNPVNTGTGVLVVNGSLISLPQNDSTPIKFCRTLTDNTQAAEQINEQPKYLVILRNLYSDTVQKWSEIQ